MKKEEFKEFVRSIILEVKKEKGQKEETPYLEKKDGTSNYLNGEKSKYKKNIDTKPNHTASALVKKIETAVKKIDSDIDVRLLPNDNIGVVLNGIFTIRVNPKGGGLYDVEAFRNLSDRVYAVALDDKQVLNFIKVNFATNKKSYQQKSYDKVMDNLKDKTEKKAGELPKGEKVGEKDVPEKEKEDAVTDEKDEPTSPMSVADDPKRQEDYGVEKNKQMPKIQKMIKTANKENQ